MSFYSSFVKCCYVSDYAMLFSFKESLASIVPVIYWLGGGPPAASCTRGWSLKLLRLDSAVGELILTCLIVFLLWQHENILLIIWGLYVFRSLDVWGNTASSVVLPLIILPSSGNSMLSLPSAMIYSSALKLTLKSSFFLSSVLGACFSVLLGSFSWVSKTCY